MGWCFHYLPFFLMDRQLFLHHYLPALYFSILLLCVTFDLLCRFMPNRYRLAALILVSTVAIYVFKTRAPLAYGSEWSRSECEASKLLKTWDYDCYQFPISYDTYKPYHPSRSVEDLTGRIIDPPVAQQPPQQQEPAHSEDKPHDFLEHLLPHNPAPVDQEQGKQQEIHQELSKEADKANVVVDSPLQNENKEAKAPERVHNQDSVPVNDKLAPPEGKHKAEPAPLPAAGEENKAPKVQHPAKELAVEASIPDEQDLDAGDFSSDLMSADEENPGGEDDAIPATGGDQEGDDIELEADDLKP